MCQNTAKSPVRNFLESWNKKMGEEVNLEKSRFFFVCNFKNIFIKLCICKVYYMMFCYT